MTSFDIFHEDKFGWEWKKLSIKTFIFLSWDDDFLHLILDKAAGITCGIFVAFLATIWLLESKSDHYIVISNTGWKGSLVEGFCCKKGMNGNGCDGTIGGIVDYLCVLNPKGKN